MFATGVRLTERIITEKLNGVRVANVCAVRAIRFRVENAFGENQRRSNVWTRRSDRREKEKREDEENVQHRNSSVCVDRSIQFSQLISETSSSEKREERMNKDMQLTTVDHQLLLRQRIYVDVNFSIEKALTSSTWISSHQHSFMAIKSTSIQLIRLCWCYCCFTPLTHSIAQPH